MKTTVTEKPKEPVAEENAGVVLVSKYPYFKVILKTDSTRKATNAQGKIETLFDDGIELKFHRNLATVKPEVAKKMEGYRGYGITVWRLDDLLAKAKDPKTKPQFRSLAKEIIRRRRYADGEEFYIEDILEVGKHVRKGVQRYGAHQGMHATQDFTLEDVG